MGRFQYPFNTRIPEVPTILTNGLASNFRQAETEAGAQAKVDAYAQTASGLFIPKSIGDAKGDLIGFSADNTPVKISGSGVSNGSVLTFDSGETAGVGWRGFIGARAYNQTAGNIVYVGAGTPVAVPFASETFDTNSIHDNATNNTRMKLNKAGYWQVNYGILWLSSSAYTPDGYCYGYIRKNGTGNAVGGFDIYRYEAGIGTDQPYNQGSDIVYSDGDDYIEIMAISTAVPTYVVGASGREDLVYCSVAWLGP